LVLYIDATGHSSHVSNILGQSHPQRVLCREWSRLL
jgi:hypothetical protein